MTGTDPAIQAADKAAEDGRLTDDLMIPGLSVRQFGVDAAREALEPIRALHKRHRDLGWDGEWSDPYCQTCAHEVYGDLCYQPWPCTTAKLVYSTEELENPND